MADENILPRDQNRVTAAGFVSSSDAAQVLPGQIDQATGRVLVTETDGGVIGPVSSTDNAIVRWNGTAGDTIQNSVVIVSDTGAITGITSLTASSFADFASYKVGGAAGASGSFTTVDLKTVTVVNGIITSIV